MIESTAKGAEKLGWDHLDKTDFELSATWVHFESTIYDTGGSKWLDSRIWFHLDVFENYI